MVFDKVILDYGVDRYVLDEHKHRLLYYKEDGLLYENGVLIQEKVVKRYPLDNHDTVTLANVNGKNGLRRNISDFQPEGKSV